MKEACFPKPKVKEEDEESEQEGGSPQKS